MGAKIQGLLEVNPTPQTLILGLAQYSTAFDTYYGLARLGYSITRKNDVFIGPELTALGDNSFEQWRIGGHLTGPSIGHSQFTLSGGYISDRRSGSGVYGTVEVSVPF